MRGDKMALFESTKNEVGRRAALRGIHLPVYNVSRAVRRSSFVGRRSSVVVRRTSRYAYASNSCHSFHELLSQRCIRAARAVVFRFHATLRFSTDPVRRALVYFNRISIRRELSRSQLVPCSATGPIYYRPRNERRIGGRSVGPNVFRIGRTTLGPLNLFAANAR